MRQRVKTVDGKLVHYYEDSGPARAVPGHGRPLGTVTTPGKSQNATISDGGRQLSGQKALWKS